jgi:PAS domain S-box-containing protein
VKLRHTLQARVAVLVIAAVLPLAAFSVYTALRDARSAVEQARSTLLTSASLAATGLNATTDSVQGLLTAMTRANDLRDGSVKHCQAYVSKLREQFPQYTNFGIIDMDGRIRCSSRGNDGLDVSDRLYFKNAVASRDFAIGDHVKSRVTGADALGFGLPIFEDGGRMTGVLYAAIDLSIFSRSVSEARLPPGGRMSVVDNKGTFLALQTENAVRVGDRITNPELLQAIQQRQAGVVEAADTQGRERIYAFAPGRTSGGGVGLTVTISMDRDQVLAAPRQALLLEMAVLFFLATAGSAVAWVLAGRALVRPVQRMLDTAEEVANGAVNQRVELGRGAASELQKMGDALNFMADALQKRQHALEAELRSSQQARDTQTMIFNSMQEGLWAVDTEGTLLLYNEAAARVLPIEPIMRPAPEWPAYFGVYLPDSEIHMAAENLPLSRALQGQSGQSDVLVRNELVPQGCVLRCSYRPMTDAGRVVGGVVVFSDITELRKAEIQEAQTHERLKEIQRRLVDALRIGRIGNWELDLQSGSLWWSDEVHEIFGIPRGSFDGRHESLVERIHPDDREVYLRRREDALRRQATLEVEFRIVMPDGSVRWVQQRGELHRDLHDRPTSRAGVVQDITSRKKSEAELFLLRNAVDHINDIVMIAELEDGDAPMLRTVFVNAAVERLTGHPADSVIGRDALSCYGPDIDKETLARMRDALARGLPVREQLLACTRTGGQLWLEFDVVPFVETTGSQRHWILVGRDMTGRKLAESALAESEQRYQALFEQAPLPMWVFNEQGGQFLAVNEAAIAHYGYTREEFMSRTLYDVRPARERARMTQRITEGYEGTAQGWTHRRKDGVEFPVDVMSRPVVYAGMPARFAIVHDISARVQAEQNLQEYMFTLQRSTDASQMVVSHQTLQGTLHEVVEQSRAVIRAHQAIVSLVYGGNWGNAVHAVSMSDKYANYRDYASDPDGKGIYSVVTETNRPMRMTQAQLEAHPRWRNFGNDAAAHPPMRGWLAVPLINRHGENIGVLQLTDKYEGEFSLQDEYVAMEMAQLASIALENVSLLEEVRALNAGLEQKVEERTRELAREQARYRALSDQAPQIIWSYEPGRGVTYFNRTWYDLVGGTADYWLGNRWMEAIHPDDRDEGLANWTVARQARTVYKGERRLRDKYGRYHIMSYRGAPVFDEHGQVMLWVGIDTDVTESKTVEAELRESNRELEAFSYSVSHDLRSPLNTIHGFSKLLARELGQDGPQKVTHYLERIQAAAGYMGQLIEDLLSLAQVSRANLRSEPVDLSEMARSIADRLRQTEPQRDVTVDVEGDILVQGDPRLLRVVLENLLGNAWKFTAHTPDARITVGSLDDRRIFYVRDNGAGFDMTYANKLFGMFQRLHAASEFPGTGIGLATVHRIVTRHHGRVWAHSEIGKGATFFWTLGDLLLAAGPVEPDIPT